MHACMNAVLLFASKHKIRPRCEAERKCEFMDTVVSSPNGFGPPSTALCLVFVVFSSRLVSLLICAFSLGNSCLAVAQYGA